MRESEVKIQEIVFTDLLTPEKSSLEKSRYVNETHNGEFLKNKMIKIRTKYFF